MNDEDFHICGVCGILCAEATWIVEDQHDICLRCLFIKKGAKPIRKGIVGEEE